MLRVLILLAVIAGVAGCGRLGLDRIGTGLGASAAGAKRNTVTVEGVRYRSRANVTSEDKRSFTISVSPVGNPDTAKEVGRYQATVYCLRNYGGSDTEWTVGPDDPAQISDGSLALAGRCVQR